MADGKIAVLSVSAGAGHVRAAEALVSAAGRREPSVEIVHQDVLDLAGSLFRKTYADGYVGVVDKQPQLWGYFYHRTDHVEDESALTRFIRTVERFNVRKLRDWLFAEDPDHVVCTHFLPAQFLSRMIEKGTWTRPVWVSITDFDCHGLWLVPRMTGYFAANEEVRWRMRFRGLSTGRIEVTGIPIMPKFGDPLDRAECARELGLDPARTTLLLMAGGAGLSGLAPLAESLLGLGGDFQIIALAGRNADLLAELGPMAEGSGGRLVARGFTNTIERLMAASDLAATKAGGLTTSECLALGLPMVVISPIPGQEERNADYLLECDAAVKAYDDASLCYKVERLLADPARLAAMREAARALGRPDAAARILDVVLGASTG